MKLGAGVGGEGVLHPLLYNKNKYLDVMFKLTQMITL